jgi:hypothetical protein
LLFCGFSFSHIFSLYFTSWRSFVLLYFMVKL